MRPFTLMELLVVMIIIAVLASMLLPALMQAKRTAERIVCASNLKQIATCYLYYTTDFDEWFPESHTSNIVFYRNGALENYLPKPRKKGNCPVWLGVVACPSLPSTFHAGIGKEYGDVNIWECYTWFQGSTFCLEKQKIDKGCYIYRSGYVGGIGWNWNFMNSMHSEVIKRPWGFSTTKNEGDPPIAKLSHAGRTVKTCNSGDRQNITYRTPSRHPMWGDKYTLYPVKFPTGVLPEGAEMYPSPHHGKGMNIVYLDGHVKFSPVTKVKSNSKSFINAYNEKDLFCGEDPQ